MSTVQGTLAKGIQLLEKFIVSTSNPEINRIDIWIKPEDLKPAVLALIENHWGYLITITGLDHSPVIDDEGVTVTEGTIEGLYHFAEESVIITIRVKVNYGSPKIYSICDIIPSATLYEREFIELFGVEIIDTPDTSHLVLPDGWPEKVYPLRKSFSGLTEELISGKVS
ncbi:MAG: NADH-quinone oxidoreductase subunit C [Anaerolineaceae bacterium]